MADLTLASLTAATPAMGGLLYGTQGGADRKFTLSAAGAAWMEDADAFKLDELAAPTDVTTLNATTSAHGLLPKLGGGTTNFLRADGSWAAPVGDVVTPDSIGAADYELSNLSSVPNARNNLGLSSGATMGIASQADAEAGTSTTGIMNPLRTAQAIAALAGGGGGGGELSMPNVYFVEKDGNDGTAVPGDPAHPYLTPQAAYDAMIASSYAGTIQIGVGIFAGSITVATAPVFPICIRGRGMHVSAIAGIVSGGISVDVSSDQSVALGNVLLNGSESGSPTGAAGADGGSLGMVGCVVGAANLNGTVGNPGAPGGPGDEYNYGGTGGNGGNGGAPGRFRLRDCIFYGAVSCLRGAGGAGGAGGSGGSGSGGAGMDGSEGSGSAGNYAYRCVLGGGIAFSPSDSASDVSLGQNIYGATIDNGALTELGGSFPASAIPFYS